MKKIWLIITLVAIVGVIWYVESTKVHPGAGGVAGAPQAINLPVSTSTTMGVTSSVAISESLDMIAAADRKAGYQPAIEIADPTGFVNVSSTFKLSDLIGKKIILLDFWTYSCINCIRTLPYLTSWYQRYKDQGLVIVGIHTPEFDFEKDINNVQAAVKQYGIQYPVVLDSDYGTWTAYGNLYWPHEYLIDMAGYIVHDQIGEGNYDGTEGEIQKLIAERDQVLGLQAAPMPTSTVFVPQSIISGGSISPETYFGAARNQYLANGVPSVPGDQTLIAPQEISTNSLYLVGNWNFQNEYATNNAAGARIIYKYRAAKVYFVASAPNGVTIEVREDGQPVTNAAGSDVKNGKVFIQGSRLYNLINDPNGSGVHTLEIIIDNPGLEAYTFTFG
jgi:thiol-disulfide isomerase/thioredoxin